MKHYERTPYLDQYTEDGELVVMLPDGQVVAISVVAAYVLDLLEQSGPLDLEQITGAILAEPHLQDPPEGEVSVLGLLGSLEGAKLLGLPDTDSGLN